MKKKVLGLIFSLILIFSIFVPNAYAYTHTNESTETTFLPLVYPTREGNVPFPMSVKVVMSIVVSYPGKYITYEDVYAVIPGGNQVPFNASLDVNSIKYYKNNAYHTSHGLSDGSYIYYPGDLTDFEQGWPNSNLSESDVYKAAGNVSYYCPQTIPAYIYADTVDEVVD